MPCPFFEPRFAATPAGLAGVRLPLIDEYSGVCHSAGSPVVVNGDHSRCCNQGYASGVCPRFPAEHGASALRYSITARTVDEITLLWIEEHDHAPVRWGQLHYSIPEDALTAGDFAQPVQAQALAFCRSFLVRLQAARQETNVR
jgi:hypothetical protein